MKRGEREDTSFQGVLRGRQAQGQDWLRCPNCGRQAVRLEPWLIASAETGWQLARLAMVAVAEKGGHE